MNKNSLLTALTAALFLIAGMTGAVTARSPAQKDQAETGTKKRPNRIPDQVAYEALLRSLIELPETIDDWRAREKSRVDSHLRATGLSEAGMGALLGAARDFLDRITPLDREAHQTKWKVWLLPAREPVARLTGMQLDKTRLIDSVIHALHAKLGNEDRLKLAQYIESDIKQKIIVLDLPERITLSDKSEMPAGRGYNYVITTIGFDRGEVYGWCAAIEDYDVSALGYDITCTNAGPGGKPSSAAKSGQRPAPFGIVTVLPLCVDGDCYDGKFTTNSSVMGIRIDQRAAGK